MESPAAATPPSPSTTAPAWRAFPHLYTPVLTIILLMLYPPGPDPLSQQHVMWLTALPTYFLASRIHYPRPYPNIRFTHRSFFHRTAIIFAYRIVMARPWSRFKLRNFIVDLLASQAIAAVLDRPEGAIPRRSEFLFYLLITGVFTTLVDYVPQSLGLLWSAAMTVDQALYHATWMALVDDLVKVLGYANVQRKRDMAVVIITQALVISCSVCWLWHVSKFRARAEQAMVAAEAATQENT